MTSWPSCEGCSRPRTCPAVRHRACRVPLALFSFSICGRFRYVVVEGYTRSGCRRDIIICYVIFMRMFSTLRVRYLHMRQRRDCVLLQQGLLRLELSLQTVLRCCAKTGALHLSRQSRNLLPQAFVVSLDRRTACACAGRSRWLSRQRRCWPRVLARPHGSGSSEAMAGSALRLWVAALPVPLLDGNRSTRARGGGVLLIDDALRGLWRVFLQQGHEQVE